MNKMSSRNSKRSAKGSSIIELSAIAFVMPLVMLICVNVGVMVFAAWLNDAACRDAARAAAERSNPTDAYRVADIVVKQLSTTTGGLISSLVLLGTEPAPGASSSGSFFEYNNCADPATGEPIIGDAPYVKVTTQLVASLPAPIVFNGASFTNQVKFRQSYSFPLVNATSDAGEGDDDGEEIISNNDEDDKAIKEAADRDELEAALLDFDNDPPTM